jgi:hypothetical protein
MFLVGTEKEAHRIASIFNVIALNYGFERFYRIENLWFYRLFDKTDILLVHSTDSGIVHFIKTKSDLSGNQLYQVKSDNDSIKSMHHIFKKEGFWEKQGQKKNFKKLNQMPFCRYFSTQLNNIFSMKTDYIITYLSLALWNLSVYCYSGWIPNLILFFIGCILALRSFLKR